MTNLILRFGKAGVKMCPVIAEAAGLKVFSSSDGPAVPADANLVFRWGCTAPLPGRGKVVNKIEAIERTCDKAGFRKLLADNGIAPKTWVDVKEFRKEEAYPVLIRPAFHERSKDMFLANDPWGILDAVKEIKGDMYISQFIAKEREIRLFIVSGRVVWGIEKTPKDKKDLSWGCVREGDFEYLGWEEWPVEAVKVGIKSMELSGLDFGAVDIILDKDGKAYVLEINTAPYLTEYYAGAIGKAFKWIVEKGRDVIPVKQYANWRDYIHPAISGKANV